MFTQLLTRFVRHRMLAGSLIVVLLGIVTALTLVSVPHNKPAHAASNGQQLAIKSKGEANSAYVEGGDQDGHRVKGCFSRKDSNDGYITTDGWYWIGIVHVDTYDSSDCTSGWLGHVEPFVPKNLDGTNDWFKTDAF